jgi:hypothetical protein
LGRGCCLSRPLSRISSRNYKPGVSGERNGTELNKKKGQRLWIPLPQRINDALPVYHLHFDEATRAALTARMRLRPRQTALARESIVLAGDPPQKRQIWRFSSIFTHDERNMHDEQSITTPEEKGGVTYGSPSPTT